MHGFGVCARREATAMQEEFATVFTQQQLKPKMPFLSLDLSQFNPIPYKYRPSRRLRAKQKARSEASSMNDVSRLRTSFNVVETVRHLRRRKWRFYDLQHIVVFGYIIFSLCILPSAPLIKTAVLAGLGLLLLMPITQQFFLPSLPIWTYLLYFFSSR